MSTIADNIFQINKSIRLLSTHYGRGENTTSLLAVSKTKPASAVREAYTAGQRDFGENYLDEALKKIHDCSDLDCCWHFIGPIQSNKTRHIAEQFDWVHTLDRLKIAERLNRQRPPDLPALQCCIQVNIDNEVTKSGVPVAELEDLVSSVQPMERLTIRGLMVIPAIRHTLESQRAVFAQTRKLFEHLQLRFPQLDTLSMGMSQDMQAAIAEGATIVRIGTAIFGARPIKNDTDSTQ